MLPSVIGLQIYSWETVTDANWFLDDLSVINGACETSEWVWLLSLLRVFKAYYLTAKFRVTFYFFKKKNLTNESLGLGLQLNQETARQDPTHEALTSGPIA